MRLVATEGAPKAVGPYSQAVVINGLVYTAGQTPLDPATGELVQGGIPEQTARALANVRAILEAAGSGMASVVKTTVFLTDMADFAEMNVAYADAFGQHRPARSTVAVKALPRGARVEIEAIGEVRGQNGGR
ncbi:MAG TPA: RidA family protein [Gemmatimonadales bacterium]|nr:RidA family protein [Gemmatimonadales bacterium]